MTAKAFAKEICFSVWIWSIDLGLWVLWIENRRCVQVSGNSVLSGCFYAGNVELTITVQDLGVMHRIAAHRAHVYRECVHFVDL